MGVDLVYGKDFDLNLGGLHDKKIFKKGIFNFFLQKCFAKLQGMNIMYHANNMVDLARDLVYGKRF